jgi:hypothetical protein
MRKPCLQCPPGARTGGIRRGLCFRCYRRRRSQVCQGKTTWAALEKAGLALPAQTPAERHRSWANHL